MRGLWQGFSSGAGSWLKRRKRLGTWLQVCSRLTGMVCLLVWWVKWTVPADGRPSAPLRLSYARSVPDQLLATSADQGLEARRSTPARRESGKFGPSEGPAPSPGSRSPAKPPLSSNCGLRSAGRASGRMGRAVSRCGESSLVPTTRRAGRIGVAEITVGSHVKSTGTARSAFPAFELDLAGPYRESEKNVPNRRELHGCRSITALPLSFRPSQPALVRWRRIPTGPRYAIVTGKRTRYNSLPIGQKPPLIRRANNPKC